MGSAPPRPRSTAPVATSTTARTGMGSSGTSQVHSSPFFPGARVCTTASVAAVTLFALLVRVMVSMGPYSGEGRPPRYGDYEAQRHWMEITLHIPPAQWYRNTSDNDLSYWGLDYPPLTAFQSYAHALLLNASAPDAVALHLSRGYESPRSKLLMRWTVLSSDLLVFFPAVLFFVYVYCGRRGVSGSGGDDGGGGSRWDDAGWLLAMILLNPCLILIDHGHFQYNCISLGLTVAAVAAILSRHEIIGSVLFSLALNHKQMSAYYAPAFLGYLLGKCLRRKHPMVEVFKLGFVVLGTFALIWLPYLHSLEATMQVLSRLAPFERGIYEDYVANFWCSSSIIIKWKKLFTVQSLKALSFAATILSFFPSMIQQIRNPSDRGFLYSLLNSSFAFYLFSFQVHEKSILLPLLPASLLAPEEPFAFSWLVHYGLLSMYPLLCRDNLLLQYVAVLILFVLIYYARDSRCDRASDTFVAKKVLITSALTCSFVLHIIYLIFKPPMKYPFLFEALIMILCFSQIVMLAVYTNVKQWTVNSTGRADKKNI